MTGGFRSVLTMRPNCCWIVLLVSILAGLFVASDADSEDSNCEIEIKVRRNTVYNANVGQELRINCTVSFCNNSAPTVSWYKLEKNELLVDVSNSSHIKTDWTRLKHSEGISFLIFKNFLSNNSGQYRCRGGGSVSHTINVSVYENGEWTTTTWNKRTTTITSTTEPSADFWTYVYPAVGIVVFVIIIIIITVISMQGCKGKSKTETQADNQYMEIPMMEQPFSQLPPRGSPSTPSSRRSTQRKPEPSQPSEPKDNHHLYGKIREDRQRQRNVVEEEGSSVVYAALNHQLPPRAAARALRPQDEFSEYAAIRVS